MLPSSFPAPAEMSRCPQYPAVIKLISSDKHINTRVNSLDKYIDIKVISFEKNTSTPNNST